VGRALHVGNGTGNAPCDEVGVGKSLIAMVGCLPMAYIDSRLST